MLAKGAGGWMDIVPVNPPQTRFMIDRNWYITDIMVIAAALHWWCEVYSGSWVTPAFAIASPQLPACRYIWPRMDSRTRPKLSLVHDPSSLQFPMLSFELSVSWCPPNMGSVVIKPPYMRRIMRRVIKSDDGAMNLMDGRFVGVTDGREKAAKNSDAAAVNATFSRQGNKQSQCIYKMRSSIFKRENREFLMRPCLKWGSFWLDGVT